MDTIAVGLDDSAAGWRALAWAAESYPAARLLAVRVLPIGEAEERVREEDAILSRLESTGLGARCELAVASSDDAARALVEIADRAELLVLGTHKTGFIHGRVFGSTGIRVAAISTGAVVAIPGYPISRRGVVAAIALDDAAGPATRFAAREAARLDDVLTLLVDVPEPLEDRDPRMDVLASAVAIATDYRDQEHVRVRAIRHQFVEAVVSAAAFQGALVVADPRIDAARATLSELAHDALMNASGPTFVVPAPVSARSVLR